MPTLLDIPASLELDLADLMVATAPRKSLTPEEAAAAIGAGEDVILRRMTPEEIAADMPPGVTSSTTPAGILQHDSDAFPGPSANGEQYGPADAAESAVESGAVTEQVIPASAAGDTVLPDVGDAAPPLPQTTAADPGHASTPEAARLAEIIEAQRKVDTAKIVVDRLKEDLKDAKESWEQRVSELGFLIKSGLEHLPLFDRVPSTGESPGVHVAGLGVVAADENGKPIPIPHSPPPTEATADSLSSNRCAKCQAVYHDDELGTDPKTRLVYCESCIGKLPPEVWERIQPKENPDDVMMEQPHQAPLRSDEGDSESEPASADAHDPDAWRYHKLEELSLKPTLTERLTNEGIFTIGQLEDLRAEVSDGHGKVKWPKGIGPAKVTEIENAVLKWLGRWHEKNSISKNEEHRVMDQPKEKPAAKSAAKPTAKPVKPAKPSTPQTIDIPAADGWEEAIEQCEAILLSVDDLPERAEDFGISIAEKVNDIKAWIEKNEHVTEAQQEALDNMESGVARWLE